MRARFLLVLTALAVVAAACGQESVPAGEGVVLRYSYQPGDELIYNTDLGMTMDMTTTGNVGIAGGFDMTMEMEIQASSTFEIDEGPDPETVRLRTSTDIVDGWATAEVLGMTEGIPLDELTGQMGALDTDMVIDAQGNVVEMLVGGQAIPPGLLDTLGGAGGSMMSGFGGGQLLGPELPDGPITVGTAWTTEVSQTTFGITFRSVSEHRVTATEVVAGRDTYRIETTTTTDPIRFTFDDLIRAVTDDPELMEYALGDAADQAQFQAAMAMLEAMDMSMDYRMDRSVAETTTWFDASGGVMVRMEMTSPQRASIAMAGIPDAGDLTMDMDMTTTAVMQLTTG